MTQSYVTKNSKVEGIVGQLGVVSEESEQANRATQPCRKLTLRQWSNKSRVYLQFTGQLRSDGAAKWSLLRTLQVVLEIVLQGF